MLYRESSSSVSWLDDKPLYSHLDRGRCVWEFSKWLPVKDWLEQCGATATLDTINVTVYSAYIQYDYQLATYTLTGKQSMIVAHINSSTSSSNEAGFLPPPIHALPEKREDSNSDAYIFPIAVQQSTSESEILQVYFYSVLPLGTSRQIYTAIVANFNSTPPALLHTDTIGNTSKQIWMLEIVGTVLPMPILVVFQPNSDQAPPSCELDCAVNDESGALQFSLAAANSDTDSDDGSSYRPAFRATVSLRHDPDLVGNYTEPFTPGKIFNGDIKRYYCS